MSSWLDEQCNGLSAYEVVICLLACLFCSVFHLWGLGRVMCMQTSTISCKAREIVKYLMSKLVDFLANGNLNIEYKQMDNFTIDSVDYLVR